MKNIRGFVLAVGLLVGASVFALPHNVEVAARQSLQNWAIESLNWKVGDKLNFDMKMSPLPINGTMTMEVTKDEAEGFTLIQNVDMGQMGKQNVEALVDRDTGKIKKLIVNGQPQTPPDQGKIKVIKQEEAHITVPAGEYDCIHLVTENEKQEQSEAWINPMAIPISGMLKMKAKVQGFLDLETELTSFARGQ